MPIIVSEGASTASVGGLIDRVLRDYLLPPDDQPLNVTLNGDHDDSTTSLTTDTSLLAGPDEDVIAPGVAIEFGTELMLITAIGASIADLTVVRGVRGTTKQTHSDGDLGQVAPPYSRQTVLDAVADNVIDLSPTLYSIAKTELTIGDDHTEVPVDVLEPRSLYWNDGGDWKQADIVWLDEFPPSSTGRAIRARFADQGATAHMTYRTRFSRPSTESDELGDFGVQADWEQVIVIGAAAQLIGARDLSSAQQQYLTRQLEGELHPVGSNSDLRQSLLQLYQFKLRQAQSRLASEGHERIHFDLWGGGR